MRSSFVSLFRVAVLGAGGGIGQPLSMLMKMHKDIKELRLYDVRGAPGVAADLSHVSTACKVVGYGPEDLAKATTDVDLVLMPAGVPRKPGMTRDDLFNTNASIARDLALAVGRNSPNAIIGVISNPVNSTVPVAAAALEKARCYNPKKLFGVTILDVVRARSFVSEAIGKHPSTVEVDVIGGHSGDTIIPILSPIAGLSAEQAKALTHRIQFGGDEVVKAKAGAGSATLSMAFAGSQWADSVLRALSGEKGITTCAYVESTAQPGCRFFATPVELGTDGVAKVHPIPKHNAYEEELLSVGVTALEAAIKKGLDFGSK